LFVTILGGAILYYELSLTTGPFDPEAVDGIPRLFNIAGEANLPTWFKATILFFCSQMLLVISRGKAAENAPYARHWRDLGIVFLILSMDEVATIHEEIGTILSQTLETSGAFLYGWVLVALVFLFLFVISYFGFLKSLPRMPRFLFIVSGGIYVIGALGLKMVEGWYLDTYGAAGMTYIGLITVKQFLQMFGAIMFLYALLGYARYNVEEGVLRITH